MKKLFSHPNIPLYLIHLTLRGKFVDFIFSRCLYKWDKCLMGQNLLSHIYLYIFSLTKID